MSLSRLPNLVESDGGFFEALRFPFVAASLTTATDAEHRRANSNNKYPFHVHPLPFTAKRAQSRAAEIQRAENPDR